MAPAEGADDKAEPNVAAQALQSSDGSDGGASDGKEEEEETKFVEWDPSGRFGRVRSRPPRVSCFFLRAARFARATATRSVSARARRGSFSFRARIATPRAALLTLNPADACIIFHLFADDETARPRDVQERVHGV